VLLFATGVALLVRHQSDGVILTLHKASFVVWLGATGVHVLAHLAKVARTLRTRVPGTAARLGLVGAVLASGALLAVATLPAADQLQDRATARIGLDSR
jgi:hypothetical protein